MIEIDCTDRENITSDERMMLRDVICDDADLYYLDCFLKFHSTVYPIFS